MIQIDFNAMTKEYMSCISRDKGEWLYERLKCTQSALSLLVFNIDDIKHSMLPNLMHNQRYGDYRRRSWVDSLQHEIIYMAWSRQSLNAE